MTGWYASQGLIQTLCTGYNVSMLISSFVSLLFLCSVVLFPIAVTFFITWWFIQFVDGFFSPLYAKLGFDIFGNCLCFIGGTFFLP
jgi:hypothetical protein